MKKRVSESSSNVVVGKASSRHRLHKFLIVFAVLLLFAAGGYAYWRRNNNHKDTTQASLTNPAVVCKEDRLKEAGAALTNNNLGDLQKATQEIQKLEGYASDPNCLYITLTVFIRQSDAVNARTELNKLLAVDTADFRYNEHLGSDKTPLVSQQSFQETVEFLEQSQNEPAENVRNIEGV